MQSRALQSLLLCIFENDAEGRAEIEFFMSLLADSGIDCYFSDWKKKTEKAGMRSVYDVRRCPSFLFA